jgi:16S rRNA (guanine527-N7)-methyltransferase
MVKNIKPLLEAGLHAMELSLLPEQIDKMLIYLQMLDRWNESFNLTAIRSQQEMISRHLLDSLTIHPYLKGETILDVGTGAGLPGIPLSIFDPSRQYYLLDSNQKKQVFVSQVIRELSLSHVKAVHSTVEAYQPTQKFSTIVARAFAPLPKMVALSRHLLAADGQFLAMMGKVVTAQLDVPQGLVLHQVAPLNVPGEKAERHLAIVQAQI